MRRYKHLCGLSVWIGLLACLGSGCGKNQHAAPPASPSPTASAVQTHDNQTDSNLLARVHFVGFTQLLSDTNAAKTLNELAGLPETAALRDDTLRKLATAPYRFLLSRKRLPEDATDEAALLRPLLDDLVQAESYLELRKGASDGQPETVPGQIPDLLLAVHLSADRAEAWQTNLTTVLEAWTRLPVTEIHGDGFTGWELKKHHAPNLVRFARAGDWALLGWGENEVSGWTNLWQRLKARGRPVDPTTNRLELFVNGPALGDLRVEGIASPIRLPRIQYTVGFWDDNFRTRATLKFPEPLNLSLPDWRIPTNAIHNPFIQFACARGIAPWLEKIGPVRNAQAEPLPDQYYLWAMQGIPFETYLAAAVTNGTNYLELLGSRLVTPEPTNQAGIGWGHFKWDASHTNLHWAGLPPMIAPFINARSWSNGDFVMMGLFPGGMRRSPPPPELFAQVTGRTNLVYYDWEITGERLGQWLNLMAVYHMANRWPLMNLKGAAKSWVMPVAKRAGNCATEVTLTAPDELTLVRKSPLALSSLELALLLRYEDAPNFPLDAQFPTLPTHFPGKSAKGK